MIRTCVQVNQKLQRYNCSQLGNLFTIGGTSQQVGGKFRINVSSYPLNEKCGSSYHIMKTADEPTDHGTPSGTADGPKSGRSIYLRSAFQISLRETRSFHL